MVFHNENIGRIGKFIGSARQLFAGGVTKQQRVEISYNIDLQSANAAKARAAMANLDAQMRVLRETFGKSAITDLAKAEGDGNIRTEELRKSDRRRTFQSLRAPVDGTVQQLTLSTIGGVVQPAQALMVPIPYKSAA
jgi:hemolysin D